MLTSFIFYLIMDWRPRLQSLRTLKTASV